MTERRANQDDHDALTLRTQHDREQWSYVLARDAVREVDRAAIEEYSIPGIVLMENAARGLAEAAIDLLDRLPAGQTRADDDQKPHVLIVCGSGNNGGDGYALARHLHNAGAAVTLMPIGEPKPESDAAINREICRRMNLSEIALEKRDSLAGEPLHLIVDAIFGTGLDRDISGPPREAIEWVNEQRAPVLAVDVPSGLDCDTGKVHGVSVRAAMTVTFIAIKPAFQRLDVQRWLGEVRIADIGAPRELIERHGTRLPDPPPGARDSRSEAQNLARVNEVWEV